MRPEQKRNAFPSAQGLRTVSLCLACVLLALGCLVALPAPATAQAATQEELQQQLAELEKKLAEDKAALAEMKENTAEAKARKQNLESQVATLKDQISVITGSIADVQNSVGQVEQEIQATEEALVQKQAEIDQKQEEIDSQWDAFKQRMAAMQEMRDSGTMGLLSAVTNLYQFLTFTEVLQDVSKKDTEVMDLMQTQLTALAQAKAELENEKQVLEEQKAELEQRKQELQAQQRTLSSKQDELADALVQASDNLLSAQDAQAQAQAQVDSDQMDYNAVAAEIQSLIGGTAGNYTDLTFSGFICPLNSYSRVSSEYGYRTLNGKNKLHAGTDYAAPGGTSIYAAAAGYVCAAGWNSGGYGYYVLIYHGAMGDGNTYSTLYAHMQSPPSVSAGSYVGQGQVIGYVGNTGNSYGNHLHIEVWQGSSTANSVANKATRVDPKYYIPR